MCWCSYQEKFYFNPGDTGFKVFKTQYAVIGVAICWDQWFPEAARSMALQGAEVRFKATLSYQSALTSYQAPPHQLWPCSEGRLIFSKAKKAAMNSCILISSHTTYIFLVSAEVGICWSLLRSTVQISCQCKAADKYTSVSFCQLFERPGVACWRPSMQLLFYPTAIGSEPQDPSLDSYSHWSTVMRGHAGANLVQPIRSSCVSSSFVCRLLAFSLFSKMALSKKAERKRQAKFAPTWCRTLQCMVLELLDLSWTMMTAWWWDFLCNNVTVHSHISVIQVSCESSEGAGYSFQSDWDRKILRVRN